MFQTYDIREPNENNFLPKTLRLVKYTKQNLKIVAPLRSVSLSKKKIKRCKLDRPVTSRTTFKNKSAKMVTGMKCKLLIRLTSDYINYAIFPVNMEFGGYCYRSSTNFL